jgi:hypothetical protein
MYLMVLVYGEVKSEVKVKVKVKVEGVEVKVNFLREGSGA